MPPKGWRKGEPCCDGHLGWRARKFVEDRTGIKLSPKNIVHHVDGDRSNNASTNLVVCEDRSYHNLLHRRKLAFESCGIAHWRKCGFCKHYDNPEIMKDWSQGTMKIHRECLNLERQIRRRKEKCLHS